MKYQRKQLKRHTKLIVSGELTIAHAEELRAALKETLEGAVSVVLDVKNVTEIDTSALQLICSAHRTAAASGKQLKLVSRPPKVLDQTISTAGFIHEIGCDHKAESNCLWSGGNS